MATVLEDKKQLDIRGKVPPLSLKEIERYVANQPNETSIIVLTDNSKTVNAIPLLYTRKQYFIQVTRDTGYWKVNIQKKIEKPKDALHPSKVSIKDLSKTFKDRHLSVHAIDKVSLEIAENEFLCIVGPSGCGKSSLLTILAGLDFPDAGEALKDGQPITGPGIDRIMMFQEPALFPWLTVRKNVEFGLKMKKLDKYTRKEIVDHYLKLVHLSNFADSYVHQLSGGMKQRAALARALVMDPEILLMDEPFAALDAQTRDILHGELQELWAATKKTIIFVTHNVQEAVCLGDRVILFSHRPAKIKSHYYVNTARPRHVGDMELGDISRAILKELKSELEIVIKEEYGEENHH